MLLKAQMDTQAGNEAIGSGALPQVMQQVTERIKPEAAYFTAEDGMRTALFFFDLADPSDIPSVAEPLFQNLKAKLTFVPVMNPDELQAGLGKLG
jgi:hypothetical protein